MKIYVTLLSTVFALTMLVIPLAAQTQRNSSLVGLNSISVLVEKLQPEAEQAGLTRDQIQSDVEIRLRDAGVPESETGLASTDNRSAYLYINVNTSKINDNWFSYSIEVSLKQTVILERNQTKLYGVATWDSGGVGSISASELTSIRNNIIKHTDKFIREYFIANPKQIKESNEELPDLSDYEIKKKNESPFTARYVGGNRQPEIQIFNDTDRTLYLDIGRESMKAYAIAPKTSETIKLSSGSYFYKAIAARVSPIEGQEIFEKGYVYSWKFYIVTTTYSAPSAVPRRRGRRRS